MKSFKRYLTEIKATQRVGIQHLDKLTPTKFLQLMKVFKDDFNGVLPSKQLQVTEKLDGSSIRLGMNGNNEFFIESSYSGPVYKAGDYTDYVISRGYEANEVSKNFEDLLDVLKKNSKLQAVLKKHNTGSGIKIVGEMFYNPMGKEVSKDKIRFIYIDYDKSKLAELLTVVPFSIEGEVDKKALIDDLVKISDRKIRFDKIKSMNIPDIDLNFGVGSIAELLKNYDKALAILQSRKHADREEKAIIKGLIEKAQSDVRTTILQYINKGKYGEEFEGIVLDILGSKLKVTSDVFRKRFKK